MNQDLLPVDCAWRVLYTTNALDHWCRNEKMLGSHVLAIELIILSNQRTQSAELM